MLKLRVTRWTHLVVSFAVGVLLSGADVAAQTARVEFSTPHPSIQLRAGAVDALAELIVQASGPGAATRAGGPCIIDVPVKGSTIAINYGSAAALDAKDARRWRYRVEVKGLPPAGTTTIRKAQVKWGSDTGVIEFTLSNAAAPAFNWKVAGLPSEWRVRETPVCHPLRITASGAPASGILLTSTLVEQTTKRSLPNLFLSLDQQTPAGHDSLEAAVNDATAVFLCTPSDVPPGKYQGTVNIGAVEKPEGDPASVTIYATNTRTRIFGGVLVLLGCLLALVFRVLVPSRIAQAQVLLPATILREHAAELSQRLKSATTPSGSQAPIAAGALQETISSLAIRALIDGNMVPSKIGTAFGGAPDTVKYKALLDDSASKLARLQVIVDGFERASQLALLPARASQLDALTTTALTQTVDAVAQAVAGILTPIAALGVGAHVQIATPTSQQLVLQIEKLNGLAWLAWVILTFTIGVAVLVLNQPAFGLPLDFLYCVLWGFGVSSGAQLSATTASTALAVTLPGRP